MTRITRKELKKDEFAAEVSKTYEFFQQRREELIRYGTVAAIVVAVVAGSFWYIQNRKQHAREELNHAVRVLFADIAQPDVGMTFTDVRSRDQAAEKELEAIAGKYSHLDEGTQARYYLAVAEDRLGKNDAATRNLRQVAEQGSDKIAPLAKFALAQFHTKSGNSSEAEKLYRELAARPTDAVPKTNALLALADLLMSSKPAEAQKILQELAKEAGANTPTAMSVQRRLGEIKQ